MPNPNRAAVERLHIQRIGRNGVLCYGARPKLAQAIRHSATMILNALSQSGRNGSSISVTVSLLPFPEIVEKHYPSAKYTLGDLQPKK